MKNLKNKKGFTIVELVIVIAVIAILAAVLIPTFGSVIDNAKESAAMQDARNAYIVYVEKNAATGAVDEDLYVKISDTEYVEIKGGQVYQQTANGNVKATYFVDATIAAAGDVLDAKTGEYTPKKN